MPDVAGELMNVFGYRYAQAYRRAIKTSSGARDAVQGLSLSEMVFSRLVLSLGGFEGLPAHPSDVM